MKNTSIWGLGPTGLALFLVFVGVWLFTESNQTPLLEWLETAVPTKMPH